MRPPVLGAWPYLTRPAQLANWLGDTEIEAAHGGVLSARPWNGDRIDARIVAFAPPSRMDLAWRWNGMSAETRVRIRLEHDGPGCRVAIAHEGLPYDAERRHAAQWWKEALWALRAAAQDDRDAHEWGDSIPIVLRIDLGCPAPDVWPLLSTAAGLGTWVAKPEVFEDGAGGAFRFTSRYRGVDVIEQGRIEAIEPERRIVFSWEWAGQGWERSTRLELTLEAALSGSALVLTHAGFGDLPPDRRLEARRNYAAAWPEVLEDLRRLVAPAGQSAPSG